MPENTEYEPHTEKVNWAIEVAENFMMNLPIGKYYHNLGHTLDPHYGVMAVADAHARSLGLDDPEREKLAIMAAFHDVGHVISNKDHEDIGAKLVEPAVYHLLEMDETEAEEIFHGIRATKVLPEGNLTSPSTLLERILCDADVDNFGRDDFFEKGELLRKEVGVEDKIAWYKGSIALLERHRYHTEPAQVLRNGQKQRNLEELYRRVS